MTRDEIETAYPGCPDAVGVLEHPEWENMWGDARAAGLQPDRSALIIRTVLRNMTATYTELGIPAMAGRMELVDKALPQLDHPDFVKYVAAKLGYL